MVVDFIFHFVHLVADNFGVEKNREFVLSSCKINQDGWMESEAYLEPSRTSMVELF